MYKQKHLKTKRKKRLIDVTETDLSEESNFPYGKLSTYFFMFLFQKCAFYSMIYGFQPNFDPANKILTLFQFSISIFV